MITIVSLKTPTGRAFDAVDTVHTNVFRSIGDDIQFKEAKGFFAKLRLLYALRPEFALGIGDISDIFFILLKPRSVRYVIAWHALLRKTITWPVRKFLFTRAAFVIAVSDCAAGTVRKFFPLKKVFTAVNGADTIFFNPSKVNRVYLAEKFSLPLGVPIVLFVGALFERKRPDVFISVAKKIPNAHFVLVGRKDKKDFLSTAKGFSNIQWISHMERNDMAVMMASADVFLFPSVNEPCAAVIPEAMSSGVPVLLSKSCGNRELVIDSEDGFLIPVGDGEEAQFLHHLKKLLDDEELRKHIGENARKTCGGRLSWRSVAAIYKKIFLENI